MKFNSIASFFCLLLGLNFLFLACQSQKQGFSNGSQSSISNSTLPNTTVNKPTENPSLEQASKTAADSTKKVIPNLNQGNSQTKQNTPLNSVNKFEDEDNEDKDSIKVTSTQPDQLQKYKKQVKEKGKMLSGGFVAAGMAFLTVSLVLVIIGSGSAGLLAIIGGSLFLLGFILSMVALLSR